jgi:hypothetical protein
MPRSTGCDVRTGSSALTVRLVIIPTATNPQGRALTTVRFSCVFIHYYTENTFESTDKEMRVCVCVNYLKTFSAGSDGQSSIHD